MKAWEAVAAGMVLKGRHIKDVKGSGAVDPVSETGHQHQFYEGHGGKGKYPFV